MATTVQRSSPTCRARQPDASLRSRMSASLPKPAIEPPMSELIFDWKHLAFAASRAFTETYGFNGSQGLTNLEGVLIRPGNRPSAKTLLRSEEHTSELQSREKLV